MRIPLGNFGSRGPDPVQHTSIGSDGGDAAARAAQNLGNTGVQVAAGFLADQRHENEALVNARAGNALLDREIQIKTLNADLEQRLVDGSLRHEQAIEAYKTAVQFLDTPTVEGMGAATAETFARGMKRAEFSGLAGIQQAAEKAKRVEFKGQTDGALDRFGKLAGMPGADIDKINAQVDALDPIGQVAHGQNWGKVKQDFRDRNWTAQATQRAMQSRESLAALQALEHDLTDPDGLYAGKLDTDKRNAVLHTVISDRSRLENRIQHDADKRLADAEKAVQEFGDQITTTTRARPEDYLRWADRVRGNPEQEAQFVEMMSIEKEVQKVIALPPEQQDKFLSDARAAQRVGGASEKQIKMLNALDTAVGNNRKLMADEPLRYLTERTGKAFQPLSPAMLQQGGGAVSHELQARLSALSGLLKTTGGRTDLKLLSKDESDQIGKALADAPVAAQGAMLGLLHNGIGDQRAYADTVRQVTKDDPVLAYAGIAKGRNLTTTNGRALSDLLLEGRAIVRDGSFKMPTEKTGSTSMQQTFSEYVGDAIEPGASSAREDTFKAASAVYAKLAKDAGKMDGSLDTGIYQNAVRLVTGGVIEHAGYKTIPPYGMDADAFGDRAQSAKLAAEKTNGAPRGSFSALQLRAIGPNRYELLNGQRRQVGKDGAPIILTIK